MNVDAVIRGKHKHKLYLHCSKGREEACAFVERFDVVAWHAVTRALEASVISRCAA